MKIFEDVEIFTYDKTNTVQFIDILYTPKGNYARFVTYDGTDRYALIQKDEKGEYFTFAKKKYYTDDFEA